MATVDKLMGGSELCIWFGVVPSFHDSAVTTLELRQGDISRIAARTFRIGPEVDPEGYFVTTKRVTVTFNLHDLVEVELYGFMEAAYMDGLDIIIDDEGTTLDFESSYGVHGRIKARRVEVTFTPDD